MGDGASCAWQKLVQCWQDSAAGIMTRAASHSEIGELEKRYDLTLPPSFRQYLSHASPVNHPSWDNELTNWWPLTEIKSVAEGYEHAIAPAMAAYSDKLMLFADFSIWCWGWAINCAAGADYGKIAVIGGGERFVSDSFDQFVGQYLDDWISVAP